MDWKEIEERFRRLDGAGLRALLIEEGEGRRWDVTAERSPQDRDAFENAAALAGWMLLAMLGDELPDAVRGETNPVFRWLDYLAACGNYGPPEPLEICSRQGASWATVRVVGADGAKLTEIAALAEDSKNLAGRMLARELIERNTVDSGSGSPSHESPEHPRPPAEINVPTLTMTVRYPNGQRHFDLPDARSAAFLKVLLEKAGQYIPSNEFTGDLDGIRPDRVIAKLPPGLQKLIESKPGAGFRLVLPRVA